MLKSLSVLLLVFSASPVFSFDLQLVDLAAVKGMAPAVVTAPAVPKAASQSIWMTVRNNPSFREAEANDWSSRIEARVRENFTDDFAVNLRADSDYSWGSIRKSGSGYYTLSGSGIFLSMNGSNGSYYVNGTVTENGRTTQVNVNVYKRFDDFSYNVSGFGLNLYTDRNSMNGTHDPERFSKKAVAAVTSLVLALQVEKSGTPTAQKAAENREQIWLTIRPGFGGWNTVEAKDPFARIEVGLRKIFDREYDAEISVGNNRVFGRVSNFFSSRYELRAGGTDLRMEEWAGRYELRGTVETNSAERPQQAVNMEMRGFGGQSFYIQETGMRFNIDRNAISGYVDTKLYPKEVVGAIASLVMAYYQQNPLQP